MINFTNWEAISLTGITFYSNGLAPIGNKDRQDNKNSREGLRKYEYAKVNNKKKIKYQKHHESQANLKLVGLIRR